MAADTTGILVPALTGAVFVGVAVLSLRSGSQLRRLYGVDVTDDAAVRSNAAVFALCGLGLCGLAIALAVGVSGRVIGVATVLGSAALCVGLGWLIRYRDRRDLLTNSTVDRPTARRLGAAAIFAGLTVLPLAPALWLGASDLVIVGLAIAGSQATLIAIAVAYS